MLDEGDGGVGDNADKKVASQKIEQLKGFIARLTEQEQAAYSEALRQTPELLRSDSLYLKFLRAENFDVGLAAHRITQYFDLKLKWFGKDLLGRDPICQSDLNESGQRALRTGSMQLLPGSDAAGRKVLFSYCDYSVDTVRLVRALTDQ